MKKHTRLLNFLLLFLPSLLQAQPDSCTIQAAIIPTNPTCFGVANGFIDIPNVRNAELPFLIEMGERTATSLIRFVGLAAGTYTVNITDAVGCVYTETLVLEPGDPFILEAGPDKTVNLGESVTVIPTANRPIANLEWQLVNGMIDTNLIQNFTPTVSGFYRLTATSEDDCQATDSIFIEVNRLQDLYVPNVFSPNGDGINDFFSIPTDAPHVQAVTELAIYDRWGNQVFQQQTEGDLNKNIVWDGQYQGQVVARGTYVFMAKVLFLDGNEEMISGGVSVVY